MRIKKIMPMIVAVSISVVMLLAWIGGYLTNDQSSDWFGKSSKTSGILEVGEVAVEVEAIADSLFRLEQALIDAHRGELDQELKQADAVIIEMDKIVSGVR